MFHGTGQCRVWQFIDRFLDRADLLVSEAGESEVPLSLDVLSWCVEREREAALGPPDQANPLAVTSDEYRAQREGRGLPCDVVTMAKAYQLLSVEGLTGSGGFNVSGGECPRRSTSGLRPFRQVASIDDTRQCER